MNDIWKIRREIELKAQARLFAMEDPRIQDLVKQIGDLKKQKKELEDDITNEIYKALVMASKGS